MNNILSSNIDTSKVFLVYSADLEGRIDPEYYKPFYNLPKNREFYKLKRFVKNIIHPPEYPREFSPSGFQLIRSQNVRPLGINLAENPVYFSEEFLEKRKYSLAKKGDILVVRSGVNAGDTACVDMDYKNAIVGADTLLCRCKSNILPKFIQVYFFTDFGKAQINKHTTGATNKHLNSENLGKVLIPSLSLSIQEECVNIFDDMIIKQRAKKKEKKELLNDIENYLLEELDITLPTKKYNLRDRIFIIQYTDLIENRLDPLSIINKEFRIEGGRYPNKKLKQIAKIVKGQSITSNKIIEGKYPVIAGGQSSPYSHCEYNHEGNVITVSASGAYAGYVWYHSSPIFASDCNVIKSKDEQSLIKTKFLYEVLKIKQKEIYTFQQGAGQPHVYGKDLEKLNIPIPPIDKQVEIIENINTLRSQAIQLQQEADNILLEAKKEIEKYILES